MSKKNEIEQWRDSLELAEMNTVFIDGEEVKIKSITHYEEFNTHNLNTNFVLMPIVFAGKKKV